MSQARIQLVDYEVLGLPANYASLTPIHFSVLEANPIEGHVPYKAECVVFGEDCEKFKRLKLSNGSRIEAFGVLEPYLRRDKNGKPEFNVTYKIQDLSILGFEKKKVVSEIDDELPFGE